MPVIPARLCSGPQPFQNMFDLRVVTTRYASWSLGQKRSSSTAVCDWQPLDGAPAVVHLLHFRFPILRQVVFGRPRFRFPTASELQLWWWNWHPCAPRAESSAITSLVMIVFISSHWHLAQKSLLQMFLGQKMRWISWGLCERRQLGKVILGHLPALWSIQKGRQYTALVELQLSLDVVLCWPPDCIQSPRGIPGFAQSALNVLVGTSILSGNAAKISKGLCAGKGLVIKQDWCWSSHVQGHDLHFSLADLQSYLMTKLAETVCLLLHVLMRVRQQHKVIGKVEVLLCI